MLDKVGEGQKFQRIKILLRIKEQKVLEVQYLYYLLLIIISSLICLVLWGCIFVTKYFITRMIAIPMSFLLSETYVI